MLKYFITKKCRFLFYIIFSIISFPMVAQTDKYEQAYLHYCDKEYDKSYQEFREFALEPDPYMDMVFIYAEHLYYGFGVEPNRSEALTYYMKSADLGYKLAQSRVCEILYDDNDIYQGKIPNKENQKLIYKYSRLFCSNTMYHRTAVSEGICSILLYFSYRKAWGCEKNPKLATMWLAYSVWYDISGISEECMSKQYPEYNKLESEWDREVFAYNIMHSIVFPYLDNTYVCDTYWKSLYYIWNQEIGPAKQYLLMTINNPDISRAGKKACIESLLTISLFIDTETKNKLKLELLDLIDIDEDETLAWEYSQIIKVLSYTDAILNE